MPPGPPSQTASQTATQTMFEMQLLGQDLPDAATTRAMLDPAIPDEVLGAALNALLKRCRPGDVQLKFSPKGRRVPLSVTQLSDPHPLVSLLNARASRQQTRLATHLLLALETTFPAAGMDLVHLTTTLSRVLLRPGSAWTRLDLLRTFGPHLPNVEYNVQRALLQVLLGGLDQTGTEQPLNEALETLGAAINPASLNLQARWSLLVNVLDTLNFSRGGPGTWEGETILGRAKQPREKAWVRAVAGHCWDLCAALNLQDEPAALLTLGDGFQLKWLRPLFGDRLTPSRLSFRRSLSWSEKRQDARGWLWRAEQHGRNGTISAAELDELRFRSHRGRWNGYQCVQDLNCDGSMRENLPWRRALLPLYGLSLESARTPEAYREAIGRWPSPGLARDLRDYHQLASSQDEPELARTFQQLIGLLKRATATANT